MTIPFHENIIKLLFEPELLCQLDLNKPIEHKNMIQAYAQLEYEDGFIHGISSNEGIREMIEKSVIFFLNAIRQNKTEDILYMYRESKGSYDSLRLFMVSFHRANKLLNRYGF